MDAIFMMYVARESNEQILDGSHTLTDFSKEAIQATVMHGLCRASSVISFILPLLFNDQFSLFHVFIV